VTRWEIYALRWSCPFCGCSGFTTWLSWMLTGTRKLHPCNAPLRDVMFLLIAVPITLFVVIGSLLNLYWVLAGVVR
jgi:hypothetical protein